MNVKNQLNMLALLCTFYTSNIFCSHSGLKSISIPACLQVQLKCIDEMSVVELLSTVILYPKKVAARFIAEDQFSLKSYQDSFVIEQAKLVQLILKAIAIDKELDACPENELKKTLRAAYEEIDNQCNSKKQEVDSYINDAVKKKPHVMYNYTLCKLNVRSYKASLLLAQKEDLEKLWQQKEIQWQQDKGQLQQEKAQLQAVINGYNLLENGLQIEGMPHEPGGINPGVIKSKLKRNGSF